MREGERGREGERERERERRERKREGGREGTREKQIVGETGVSRSVYYLYPRKFAAAPYSKDISMPHIPAPAATLPYT